MNLLFGTYGMMGYGRGWDDAGFMGGSGAYGNLFIILNLVTWLVVLVILVGLARWIWKKGDRVK